MKIALINGSPKKQSSASQSLLADLKRNFPEEAEITEIGLHSTAIPDDTLDVLNAMDAWVFAFPLYVDGIPAHLLSCLVQLEQANMPNPCIHIYGIVNCGFFEGIQTELSIAVLQNWCAKAGFTWGAALGVGGGGSLAMMPKLEPGVGPKAPVDRALNLLSSNILHLEPAENRYVSVAMPRFLYKMAGQIGWRQMIKSNGGKAKDLAKRPE